MKVSSGKALDFGRKVYHLKTPKTETNPNPKMNSPSEDAMNPMGSDGRTHHEYGYSFLSVLEQCPGARRRKTAAKALAKAGERGTELHGILETTVNQWMKNIELGSPIEFIRVLEAEAMRLKSDDLRSVLAIGHEIEMNFVLGGEPPLVGTEEKIELKDSEGNVISSGYYDIFLKRGNAALVIDHKFVRKEVADAEVNRQGHALAIAVMQTYPDVEFVTVLFTMAELGSTSHTFNRTEDYEPIHGELCEILRKAELPHKTLKAGEHCQYCRFAGADCPASVGALKAMTSAITPMAVPVAFRPDAVESPDQMALLRYWVSVVEPICEQIKEAALSTAMRSGSELRTALPNGEEIKYKIVSRKASRKVKSALELWSVLKTWMPFEAFISACKPSVGELTTVAVQIGVDNILKDGKKPNVADITRSFEALLETNGLVERDEGMVHSLRRIKRREKKEAQGELPGDCE